MESALIVSYIVKSTALFTEILHAASISQVTALQSSGEARRMLLQRDFDLVIINAPLKDESGETLAMDTSMRGGAQVILVVPGERYDAVSASCENYGVLTISKPINRAIFWSTLKLAGAAHNRFARMRAENAKLKQTIEDIRIIDRAKCMLVSHLNMSEHDAHRHIEKQAMDKRLPKRVIAEGILKIYEI